MADFYILSVIANILSKVCRLMILLFFLLLFLLLFDLFVWLTNYRGMRVLIEYDK